MDSDSDMHSDYSVYITSHVTVFPLAYTNFKARMRKLACIPEISHSHARFSLAYF